ncbi:hypothetical protein [uncultured Acinetobacter sp.]|uniref:hypothetical protein n=1 Tax=uncultured Acinetobacter sp. TaxID=165433 RepID=UPI0025F6E8EC|nr:hypothetical protein [uncultured Acinetobacter sp.]
MTNVSQHPCANKCTDYKEEQCNTCLVRVHENPKYLKGDVVVYMNHIKFDDLEVVEAYQPNDHYWLECGQCVHESWIRTASATELLLKRRLTDVEQALAEVS